MNNLGGDIFLNKQEENISDIITLDETEKIVDIFLEHAFNTDDTVGIIANKELIEHAMDEALSDDWVSVQKVDLELDDDIEYMISIDSDGNLVVQPVTEYKDKYFTAMHHVYISMDGDVDQMTIDNCLNRDVDVVLFGYEDESNDCVCETKGCKECTVKSDDDNSKYHIIVKGNLDMDDTLEVIKDMERRMIHISEMFDEMNHFRELFQW